ncbi:MAG: MerR family DNA-binding transcriptional regulator [Alphaproteobacteria bacterium]|nr:MerR family DNA-binding transcriptional regulator [Rhodospirillales bacterium]MCW9045548.1 MerR family DNA-binding transcriptional regulator [Alphaproteobacteria bacterium]
MDKLYTVTDLATEFAITPRAVRFYESKGLITSQRVGRTRIYTKRERARLKIILRSKRVGFTLANVKAYLELYDTDHSKLKQILVLLSGSRQRITELQQQQDELKVMLDELSKMETEAIGDLKAQGLDPEEALAEFEASLSENSKAAE